MPRHARFTSIANARSRPGTPTRIEVPVPLAMPLTKRPTAVSLAGGRTAVADERDGRRREHRFTQAPSNPRSEELRELSRITPRKSFAGSKPPWHGTFPERTTAVLSSRTEGPIGFREILGAHRCTNVVHTGNCLLKSGAARVKKTFTGTLCLSIPASWVYPWWQLWRPVSMTSGALGRTQNIGHRALHERSGPVL